ncbi:hypothetical protein EJ08DRAFT_555288, partial [Tothia fuscella]
KHLYPDAPVFSNLWDSTHYEERFAIVVGELKKAVDAHRKLRDRARFLRYDLYMCGTNPVTATPSIVIFCAGSDVPQLRQLFSQKVAERLYCKRSSLLYRLFSNVTPERPPFTLVYYRTDGIPVARKSANDIIYARSDLESPLCGALVKYGNRTATLGVALEIDSVIKCLTVDHLFDARESE